MNAELDFPPLSLASVITTPVNPSLRLKFYHLITEVIKVGSFSATGQMTFQCSVYCIVCCLLLPLPRTLNFYRTQVKPGVRSMGPDVTPRPCVDLTDVTLADEDTNSILTDNANREI